MTMYSSRRLTAVEYDCRLHGDECYGCAYEQSYETDAEQHNTPNPLLIKFREADEQTQQDMLAGSWVSIAHRYSEGVADHARRVLTRLAEVTR